jgi:endonuclease III
MLDLRDVTDDVVADHLAVAMGGVAPESDAWRILGFCSAAQTRYSFSATRTYPRPDHPDPEKRLPLVFLMTGILVSLRTTLENEQRAMGNLIARFPTEIALMEADTDQIADCIMCAGMAAKKSERIHEALDRVSELDGGLEGLALLPTGEARTRLLALPGFGPKAADCMLTIGLGIPSMVVDVNVFRVASSLLGLDWRDAPDYSNVRQVRSIKDRLDAVVGADVFLCQIVHTLLLLEGKHSRSRGHNASECRLGVFCRSCELDPNSGSGWTQGHLLEAC